MPSKLYACSVCMLLQHWWATYLTNTNTHTSLGYCSPFIVITQVLLVWLNIATPLTVVYTAGHQVYRIRISVQRLFISTTTAMLRWRYDPVFSILGSNPGPSLEVGPLLVERSEDGLGLPEVGRLELEVGLELYIDTLTLKHGWKHIRKGLWKHTKW